VGKWVKGGLVDGDYLAGATGDIAFAKGIGQEVDGCIAGAVGGADLINTKLF